MEGLCSINKFHNEIMQSASKNKPVIIDVRDNTGGRVWFV